ncbi:MAG: SUMF1/EgtB/PvdO family nonheme iron enzyme [Myxococcales bacterium]|nr:SUMF1/EgtB/PvdO family nonheme iron enzyme [Myxococcales bacterium]
MAESALGRAGAVERLAIIVGGADDGDLSALATTLLASSERWQVRRVAPPLSRLTVKQTFDAIPAPLTAILVVLAAPVTDIEGEPAMVVGDDPATYPDDASVPLAWLAERLAVAAARGVVVVLPQALAPARALAPMAAALPGAVLIAGAPGGAVVATLAVALGGLASDPSTGTVTLASLGRFVSARLPTAVVRPVDDRDAFITPGALDLLRSRRIDAPASGGGVAPASVGTVLPGRFRLDAELARGTFGTVYRARQLAVERDVAIKLLHGDIDPTSPDGHLFLQEIRAVGRLDHLNVVRIYQADVAHDGRLFYAMELLSGQTLTEVAAAGAVELTRAVALVTQVLAGLAAAHDAGLIHADIKPANVIVVPLRGIERAVLVDFGLARLRASEPAASAGGTPAYMAPEQLRHGRVDARSDLFSTALVLVHLLTGWRRRKADELAPPLDGVEDARVRAALTRALAIDPAARFATAGEFAAALTGEGVLVEPLPPPPPFHGLASFTERDAERLRGRDRELTTLIDHALFRDVVVVTAPSGTGKTSLLRAGLMPALERYGASSIYVSGRAAPVADAIAQLAPDAADLAAAISAQVTRTRERLVVIVDQLEALLVDTGAAALDAFLAVPGLGHADVALVLSVREDFLARVLTRPELAGVAATVRIGPMDIDGAHAAIVEPLAERRVTVAPELLAAVLGDLVAAGAALAPELGWGQAPAVYPPHLQLVGSVLYQTLAADESTITLDHYRRLGGFDAIVGEHLERVLENELDRGGAAIARELFLALVTSTHARATSTEAELVAIVAASGGAVLEVLEVLRRQGLVVRTQRAVGEPVWELMHDSLVPRVLAWIDRHDLARRRAMEQVRYHLRRARAGTVSLLSRSELRELDAHAGALDELEAEHHRRDSGGVGPAALVAQSRAIVRRTLLATLALAATVAAIVGYAGYDRYRASVAAARERSIRDRDLGRFTLELRPFDWIPPGVNPWLPGGAAVDVPASELPELRWELHDPDPDDPDRPGPVRARDRIVVAASGAPGRFAVETTGGPAYLIVTGRHRRGAAGCGASTIPLRSLPGYARRDHPHRLTIVMPTCQATEAGQVTVPAGLFVEGGVGWPISWLQVRYGEIFAHLHYLPEYRIDITEVTNAAFRWFSAMSDVTGFGEPFYADNDELAHIADPDYPVTSISWRAAQAYCEFMGRTLPDAAQWQKALRGPYPSTSPDGRANRNLPWGAPRTPIPANIDDGTPSPAPVGAFDGDRSLYGVADLAGNVTEWTSSVAPSRLVVSRGGNWSETTPEFLVDYGAIENQRPPGEQRADLGFRCATTRR